MNRTIALAYGITGLAVAAALVAIIGSTTGLLGSGSGPDSPTTAQSQVLTASAEAAPTPRADRPEVEILQVDAPPTARGRDDDDDDDEHDDEHSEGHREHDGRGHDGREDDDD